MPRSLNQVTLIGNVGSDPDVNTTGGGAKVASFSLATSPPWKEEEVNWHKIVAWRQLADIVESYVKKGSQVAVTGRLRYSTWESKGGESHKSAEIVAEELVLLSSGGRKSGDRMQTDSDGTRVPF